MNLIANSSLKDCEAIISRGLETFTEVASALLLIRDKKLYLQTHDTFEEYCRQRWSMSARRTYQLIAAKDVADRVLSAGLPAPENEAVARALSVVPKDEQIRIWDSAIKYFKGRVTAASLRSLLPSAENLGELTHAGYATDCPKCGHGFIPIFPEKASRGPKTPSRGVRWALTQIPQGGSAVDYGCGRFRNTKLIASHFHHTVAVDTAEQIKRIAPHNPGDVELMDTGTFQNAGQFDAIFLVAVLHIVPRDTRTAIAKAITGRSKWLLVEVPTHDAHYNKAKAQPFSDGYVMAGNTFYKPMKGDEIRALFSDATEIGTLPDRSATIILYDNRANIS